MSPKNFETIVSEVSARRGLKVSILGAGWVGAITALNLAKQGHEVHLYAETKDIDAAKLAQGETLILTRQARKALAEIGLEKIVLTGSAALRGRMLYDDEGSRIFGSRDPFSNLALYTIDQHRLHEVLLTACERNAKIHYHLGHRLTSADFGNGSLKFQLADESEINVTSDFIIGCDGAYSTEWTMPLHAPGWGYTASYVDHGYLHLVIPSKDDKYQMPPRYIHIWPRVNSTLTAIPSREKCFSVTLSMPMHTFESIQTPADLLTFFQAQYPDVLAMIGENRLIEDYFQTQPQRLRMVELPPIYAGCKAAVLADAAHSLVPYYGQATSAGLEDCVLLMNYLNGHNVVAVNALQSFNLSSKRAVPVDLNIE